MGIPVVHDTVAGDAGEFRHPTPNEISVWILIIALLNRIIDAYCVDTCRSRLHLHLWPVNPWFVVRKLTPEMKPRPSP